MKVAIIAFSNPIYCPYINFYKETLQCIDNCEYDIIFLRRFKNDISNYDENYIGIEWLGKGTNAASKIEKLINFFRFKKATIRLIIKKRYDKVILLTTVPAVLMSRFLQKNYNKRYIVDIRDYTHENKKSYFYREERVLNCSSLNVISSKGFLDFLPKSEYWVCHNMNVYFDENSNYHFNKSCDGKLVVSYVGSIAYVNNCIKMIKLVERDERFNFYFYGNESGEPVISNYIRKINNNRICYKGAFSPSDKPQIYQNSDIIFNCYGNETNLVKCAISNKYYDGAFYRRPLLVSPNTIMAELGREFSFPIDLDRASSLDDLYNWYINIDAKSYDEFAANVIKTSQQENENTMKKIMETLMS